MKKKVNVQIKLTLLFALTLLVAMIGSGSITYAQLSTTNNTHENTLIAIGEPGSLPNGTANIEVLDRQILIGSDPEVEVVLYKVGDPSPNSRQDAETFLNSLPTTECVADNVIFSSGNNTWHSGGGFGINDLGGLVGSSFFKNQWAFGAINLPNDPSGVGGDNTTIAIIDGFSPRTNFLWQEKEVVSYVNVDDPMPLTFDPEGLDFREHGNLVLSLANEIAPQAEILAIDAFNDNGLSHTYNIITAVNDLLIDHERGRDRNRLLVNMSFNTSAFQECDVLDYLFEYGTDELDVLFIASAGNGTTSLDNEPQPTLYPASSPYVVSVAASDRNGEIASYSNLGDLLAPGGDTDSQNCDTRNTSILGRIPQQTILGSVRYKTVTSCGTSFAAPLVTAGLARIISAQTLNPQAALALILGNSDNPHLVAVNIGNALESSIE